MSATFHRFERSGTARPDRVTAPPWLDIRTNPDDAVPKWRCRKCGAEVLRERKPDRRFLRKWTLGETCEEWALLEVMTG